MRWLFLASVYQLKKRVFRPLFNRESLSNLEAYRFENHKEQLERPDFAVSDHLIMLARPHHPKMVNFIIYQI